MNIRAVSLCLTLLGWGGASAFGQAADPIADLQRRVSQLEQRVDTHDNGIDELQKNLVSVGQDVNKNEEDIGALTEVVEGNTALIGQVRERLEEQFEVEIGRVNADTAMLRSQLDQISREDDATGRRLIDMRAIMANRPGMQELTEEIPKYMPEQGTLVVKNRMSGSYRIRVNRGAVYDGYIPAGAERSFTVPVGTATTELVGYESPKTWTIAPPNYQQEVIIGPRAQETVVMRPVERVVERPVETVVMRPVENVVMMPVNALAPSGRWVWRYNPWWGWSRVYQYYY